MLLSDRDIFDCYDRGIIACDPFVADNVQPCSLDLRLGASIKYPCKLGDDWLTQRFKVDDFGQIETATGQHHKEYDLSDRPFVLKPAGFALGSTLERVGCPNNLVACQVADKSTLARLGLSVCFSAGWIDPGNVLNITLELYNHSKNPIELAFGMAICQLKFFELKTPSEQVYNGKYLNSANTEGAK